MVTHKFTPFLVLLLLLVLTTPLFAEWLPDGNPVCNLLEWQLYPQIASDGQDGFYVCWEDHRAPGPDIYIQHLNKSGDIYWQINGIAMCTAAGNQMRPRLVSDGAGGVIAVWFDDRSGEYDIYAQRVDSDGNFMWDDNGIPVCTAPGVQLRPDLVTDGSGGAIIAWHDWRDPQNCIYGQRVDPDGNTLWVDGGIAIMDAILNEVVAITADGEGGAIIAAYYSEDGIETDIMAHRLGPDGSPLWRKQDVVICSAPGDQNYVRSAEDGSGGVLISWLDMRDGKQDIYAQRVDYRGRRRWGKDGAIVCLSAQDKFWAAIAPDESGGAYVSWHEFRDLNNYDSDIFIQHLTDKGKVDWAEEGITLCDADYNQGSPKIISDTFGNAIVVWRDFRWSSASDTYIQKIDPSGNMLWGYNGIPVCTEFGTQTHSRMIPDGRGGAYVCWYDLRALDDYDIYATWINPEVQGESSVEPSANPSLESVSSPSQLVTLNQNNPNPFNPSTVIEYYVPRTGLVTLEIFSVSGARIRCLVDKVHEAGTYTVTWNGVNDYGSPVSSGVYFYRLRTGTDIITKKMLLMR